MEPNKNYFTVGLFVVLSILGVALFALWLGNSGNDTDYRKYRIHFSESVNGLGVGSPVKFHGVDVGRVETIAIDNDNSNLVKVGVRILKTTPVKNDTIATLRLQGITGTSYVDLDRGTSSLPNLEGTDGKIPEIVSRPSDLAALVNQAPELMNKASHLADQAGKIVSDPNVDAVSSLVQHLDSVSRRLDAESQNIATIVQVTSHMVTTLDKVATRVQDGHLDQSLDNLRLASADFRDFTQRTDAAAKANYAQFYQLLGDVRKTSRDLRDFTRNLKEDPSRVLYAPKTDGVDLP